MGTQGAENNASYFHLRECGACFLMELTTAAGQAGLKVDRDAFESAVWDLVWAGLITNH